LEIFSFVHTDSPVFFVYLAPCAVYHLRFSVRRTSVVLEIAFQSCLCIRLCGEQFAVTGSLLSALHSLGSEAPNLDLKVDHCCYCDYGPPEKVASKERHEAAEQPPEEEEADEQPADTVSAGPEIVC
jgi:hypothetical protein